MGVSGVLDNDIVSTYLNGLVGFPSNKLHGFKRKGKRGDYAYAVSGHA